MRVGIIGLGSFGSFAAKALAPHVSVFAWDIHGNQSEHATSIEFAGFTEMDVIVLAVSLDAYEEILVKLQPQLRPETLVVDVCSVKVRSRDVVRKVLGEHKNILITHPLFGPESAAESTAGHTLIVTDAIGERAEACVAFCEQVLGLQVTRISAEEHDKVMAYVHVLTFFVARGLKNLNMPQMPFETPSFSALTALIDLDGKHSDELFQTIQRANPYGDEVRRELVESLEALERSIVD